MCIRDRPDVELVLKPGVIVVEIGVELEDKLNIWQRITEYTYSADKRGDVLKKICLLYTSRCV